MRSISFPLVAWILLASGCGSLQAPDGPTDGTDSGTDTESETEAECDDLCDAEGVTQCTDAAVVTCELQGECLDWGQAQDCPPGPKHSEGVCDGDVCGYACFTGFKACDDRCIPEGDLCGTPLYDGACDGTDVCGSAALCVDDRCVCRSGYRDCADGCCKVAYTSTEVAEVHGGGVDVAIAPDGRAYVVAARSISIGKYRLNAWTRDPGGTAWTAVSTAADGLAIQGKVRAGMRSDGTLIVGIADVAGNLKVVTRRHDPVVTELITLGVNSTGPFDLVVAGDDSVWGVGAPREAFRAYGFSIAADGTKAAAGENNDFVGANRLGVAADETGEAFGTFRNSYTGRVRRGTVRMSDGERLGRVCEGDALLMDDDSVLWSADNEGVCRDDRSVRFKDMRAPSRPDQARRIRMLTSADGTVFIVFVDEDTQRPRWLSSRDGERFGAWSVPTEFEGVAGTGASVGAAADPDGTLLFAVLPSDPRRGTLTIVDMD